MIVRKLNHQDYEVVLDSTTLLDYFTYTTRISEYQFWNKRYVWKYVPAFYYDSVSYNKIVVKEGLLPYLLENFSEMLTPESLQLINDNIVKEPLPEFSNLNPEQNRDLQALSAWKRGLNQSCTGFGKTEVIATLAKYATERNEKMIILVPSDAAKREIQDRIKKVTGFDVSHYFEPDDTVNVVNVRGFIKTEKNQVTDPYWKEVKWCLADEVEYCFNDDIEAMHEVLENCERFYAFSATADKSEGLPIRPLLKDSTIGRNLNVVKYFGFCQVYHRPRLHYVDFVEILCKAFYNIQVGGVVPHRNFESDDDYFKADEQWMFLDDGLCRTIRNVARKEGEMFLPHPYKTVIMNWVNNYFNDVKVITITGDGFILHDKGEMTKLDLATTKEKVKSREVRYVMGTSCSWRALDLIGLHNVALFSHIQASVIFQAIGRVNRENHYKIFSFKPGKQLGKYSLDCEKRKRKILDYLQECKVNLVLKTDREYDEFRY